MKALMNFESSSSGIPFVTAIKVANEGLLSCVCQLMGLEVSLCYELLGTL